MRRVLIATLLILAGTAGTTRARAESLVWHEWSPEIFTQAAREHKFVYLDLAAGWCHWCHVMDEISFKDPDVIRAFNAHFLAVRADQDSRPDLAARYGDYGWPATVIFAPDGTEICKKQGYIAPRPLVRLLNAVVDDPSPIDYHDRPPEAADASPTQFARRSAALRLAWLDGYDDKEGGWGSIHKFLDSDQVELALREAAAGDAESARRARATLTLGRRLVDPVWGGVYQYSVGGGWTEPHFEKIMSVQAANLRIYALAYAQWGDPGDLAVVHSVSGYLRHFLADPEGGFRTSQDADVIPGEESANYFRLADAGRRARGVPRVDPSLYARENGWAIESLAEAAGWTGDPSLLSDALHAAAWTLAHRALSGGGFAHGDRDVSGPFLGDTLAMGRGFLALWQATGDRVWLERAVAAGAFIRVHFSLKSGFSSTATSPSAVPLGNVRTSPAPHTAISAAAAAFSPAAVPDFDENVAVARFSTALAAASGDAVFRTMAESALRWLLAPGVADLHGSYVAGALLAEREFGSDPMHIAIIGPRGDSASGALLAAALRAPTEHRLIETWDRSEGRAPRGEDIYPDLPAPAAFVCANGACSTPIATAPALEARIRKILGSGQPPP